MDANLAQLGLSSSAGVSEVQARFRRLALQYHPDKHAQATDAVRTRNENVLKDLLAARDVLIEWFRTGVEPAQATPVGPSSGYTYHDFDTTYAGAFNPDVKDPEFENEEDKHAWEQKQDEECDAIIRDADNQLNDRLGELAGDEQNETDDLEHGSLCDGDYYDEARDEHDTQLPTDYTSVHINSAARSMNLRQIEMGSNTRVSGHFLPENEQEDSDVELLPGDDIDGPLIGDQGTCRFALNSAANAGLLAAQARQTLIEDVQTGSPEKRERSKKMLAQIDAQRKKDEAEFAERDKKRALLNTQSSVFRDPIHDRTMELKAKQAATKARNVYTQAELPVDPSAIKNYSFSAILQGEMSSKKRPRDTEDVDAQTPEERRSKQRRMSAAPTSKEGTGHRLPSPQASAEFSKSEAQDGSAGAEDAVAGAPKEQTAQSAPWEDVSEEARRDNLNRVLRWAELSKGASVPMPPPIVPQKSRRPELEDQYAAGPETKRSRIDEYEMKSRWAPTYRPTLAERARYPERHELPVEWFLYMRTAPAGYSYLAAVREYHARAQPLQVQLLLAQQYSSVRSGPS